MFDDQVEDLMYHCCCFFSSFEIFRLDSFPVCRFSFHETVDCNHQLFSGDFRDVSVLPIVFNITVSMVTSAFRSCFSVLLVFSFMSSYLSKDLSRIPRKSWQCSMFPDLFLVCVMRTFFFLVLMLPIDLLPRSSSRIACILMCLWIFCCLSIPCLIFLLMSLTWALSFLHIFDLSMRAKSSWSLPSIVSSLRAAQVFLSLRL